MESMASKKTGNPVGRPSDYRPDFAAKLIEHMAGGGSFEGFGAVVNKSKQTLYDWTKAFPEFLDAKKVGLSHSLKFYEELGKMIAMGQLRRVKKETPVRGPDGEIIFDKDGKVVVDREYESTSAGQATWIFMMKNMHKWRDKLEIMEDPADDGPNSYVEFSDDDLDKKMSEIRARAKARK
jgi:hypothetical protein